MPEILWDLLWECREWKIPLRFVRFHSRNFSVKDVTRFGRADNEKADEILQLAKQETADNLSISGEGIKRRKIDSLEWFEKGGLERKAECLGTAWTESEKIGWWITVSEMLLKRNEKEQFLKRVIPGNENW